MNRECEYGKPVELTQDSEHNFGVSTIVIKKGMKGFVSDCRSLTDIREYEITFDQYPYKAWLSEDELDFSDNRKGDHDEP